MVASYALTDQFYTWLKRYKPEAEKLLRRLHVNHCVIRDRSGRCMLIFPALPTDLGDAACDFDRQIDTDCACMILDGHPDELATATRPWNMIPIRDAKAGDKCFIDLVLFKHLAEGEELVDEA